MSKYRTPVLRAYQSGKTTIRFAEPMVYLYCDWLHSGKPMETAWFASRKPTTATYMKKLGHQISASFKRDCVLTIAAQIDDQSDEGMSYPVGNRIS